MWQNAWHSSFERILSPSDLVPCGTVCQWPAVSWIPLGISCNYYLNRIYEAGGPPILKQEICGMWQVSKTFRMWKVMVYLRIDYILFKTISLNMWFYIFILTINYSFNLLKMKTSINKPFEQSTISMPPMGLTLTLASGRVLISNPAYTQVRCFKEMVTNDEYLDVSTKFFPLVPQEQEEILYVDGF